MKSLECSVTSEMFKNAFNFGIDYFVNPDKVVKDRTGTKQRGLGQILDDQMIGKIVEYGVCAIIKQNNNNLKEVIPDNIVKSEFEYGQPDIIRIKEKKGKERDAEIFIEVKNSPKNYEWLSVYDSQFDGMKKWEKKHITSKTKTDKIFVIFASLLDKQGERVFADDVDSGEHGFNKDELERIETSKIELVKEVETEIKCNSKTAEKIVNSGGQTPPKNSKKKTDNVKAYLTDYEKEKYFDCLSIDTQRGIKNLNNLKTTFVRRKSDVLGAFLKYKKLSEKFDFFYNLDDFKVKIDYVVLGKELDDMKKGGKSKQFPKDDFWASPEIFFKDKHGGPSLVKIRSTSKSKSQNGKLLKNVNEIGMKKKLTNKFLRENINKYQNPNFYSFPKQFGDIHFSEEINIFKSEKKSTGKVEVEENRQPNMKIILEVKNEISVSSDFLGEFNLTPETYYIHLWTRLEKLKNRVDIAIPKRILDQQINDEELQERIKIIAQNI